MKPKPTTDHRNAAIPPCDRCGCAPGDHRWAAISRPAEKVYGGVRAEFRLCLGCVQVFQTFMANGKNRPVTTRKQPDRFASSSPPPQNARTDGTPIR
jgi:hypothetical protein